MVASVEIYALEDWTHLEIRVAIEELSDLWFLGIPQECVCVSGNLCLGVSAQPQIVVCGALQDCSCVIVFAVLSTCLMRLCEV